MVQDLLCYSPEPSIAARLEGVMGCFGSRFDLAWVERLALAQGLVQRARRELLQIQATRGAYRRTARRLKGARVMLALAASLFGMPAAVLAGPNFAAPVQDPFGIESLKPGNSGLFGAQPAPAVADIDQDGDLDVLLIEQIDGGVILYENAAGGGVPPAFAAPVVNPFGLGNVGSNASPTIADIDGDGDLDALVGNGDGDFVFFENTETSVAALPTFGAPVVNPFGLVPVRSGILEYSGMTFANFTSHEPTVADIDGDGDLDVFAGSMINGVVLTKYGSTAFFENTESGGGTAPTLVAAGVNPYGLSAVGANGSPALVDIDADGDVDLLVGNGNGDVLFFENTVNSGGTAPTFAAAVLNPFGLVNVGYDASPEIADIDGDGHLDVLAGSRASPTSQYADTVFFENTASTPVVSPCASAPRTDCIDGDKGLLVVNEKNAGREKLKALVKKLIVPTVQEHFGDPVTGTTSYRLCLYDESDSLVGDMEVERAAATCGSKPCWKPLSTKGFKYSDKETSSDGAQLIVAKAGEAGKGIVKWKGKNDVAKGLTSLPTGLAAELAANAHVTVQVVTDDAACFGAVLPDVKRADGILFKAKR